MLAFGWAAGAFAAGKEARPADLVLVVPAEPGQRLVVHGTVLGPDGRPVGGALLHVYQTDSQGRYTPERPMDEPHARLAGWARTAVDGRFRLETIRPGGYPKSLRLGDRERKIPAHVHIDLTATGLRSRKVQVVFADDPLLKDPYWQDWVKRLDQPVAAVTADGGMQFCAIMLRLERE